jgi:hypothetical protein
MKHVTVESSHIASIAHDGAETMHVTFKGKDGKPGATYAYQGVTVAGHKKLMEAESVGKHLRTMDVKGVRLGD